MKMSPAVLISARDHARAVDADGNCEDGSRRVERGDLPIGNAHKAVTSATASDIQTDD